MNKIYRVDPDSGFVEVTASVCLRTECAARDKRMEKLERVAEAAKNYWHNSEAFGVTGDADERALVEAINALEALSALPPEAPSDKETET